MCFELCVTVNGRKLCFCIPPIAFSPKLPHGPIEEPGWLGGDAIDPAFATELSAIATISAATDFLAGEQEHVIRTALGHVTAAMERRMPGVTLGSRPGNPRRG
jgi:hypothetical protein